MTIYIVYIQEIVVFYKETLRIARGQEYRISQISQEYKISQISQKMKYLTWKRYNFKETGKACTQTSSCQGHKTFSTLRRPTLTVLKTSSVSPRWKNERKTNLFSDFVRLSLYSTYFTLDLVNAVPNVRVQSLHLSFIQPKLPEPRREYYDEDQTPNHTTAVNFDQKSTISPTLTCSCAGSPPQMSPS